MRMLMKGIIIGLVLGVAVQAAAQPEPIRVPVPAGWTAADEEYRFDRENLWEYINGAADLFLSYGFRELVVLDLEQGDAALSVSVYDMGRPLDAFGVYEREKPAGGDNLAGIGAAAVLQPPYRGLILKDRFYVKIEVGGGDVSAELLGAAMQDIATGLPGVDDLPAQLEMLPEEGRMPGTVAFAGSDFLGLADLKNCLYATYQQADGKEYRLFVMKPSRAFLTGKSPKWNDETGSDGVLVYWREIPYEGVVVLRGDENRLLGVAGLADYESAAALLETLPH